MYKHNWFIYIDQGSPGFYLTINGSNFTMTAGTMFSSIPAWIAYGITSESLALYEVIGGHYVTIGSLVVDYDIISTCLAASLQIPLLLRISLAGSDPYIPNSLVGEHVILVKGNRSNTSLISPSIYIYGAFDCRPGCMRLWSAIWLSESPTPLQFKMVQLLPPDLLVSLLLKCLNAIFFILLFLQLLIWEQY